MSDCDLSLDSDNVSLSDSIYSNSEGGHKGDDKVVDMSRWRDGSMTKEVLCRGKGWTTPLNGTEVSVHYVAKREDGSVIESTRDRDKVFTFTVGRKQVIKGFDIAIKTMKWSEISKFKFSGEYAYDEDNCPEGVTPGAPVTYEVELFYFKLLDLTRKKDGGVTKRIITPGEGYDLAIFGSKCEVKIVGTYEGNVFEKRNVFFVVGEAEDHGVIDGIEIAVTKMRKLEKCKLFVKPEYAFGPKGKPEFGIPDGYKQLVYEITLKDFSTAKEPFELLNRQKLETSEALKTKGNDFFNRSKYSLAVKQYKRMIKTLKHDSRYELIKANSTNDISEEEYTKERDRLLFIAYHNLSNCYHKMKQLDDCLQCVYLALRLDPYNSKALYRRGRAYYDLQEYEKAREDFVKSLQFGPNNTTVQNFITLCNDDIKARNQKDSKIYSKLFKDSKPKLGIELKDFGDVLNIDDTDKDVDKDKPSTSH